MLLLVYLYKYAYSRLVDYWDFPGSQDFYLAKNVFVCLTNMYMYGKITKQMWYGDK